MYAGIWTEAFWVMTGQVLGALGALVGIRILTAYMSPAEYGMLSLLVSFASVVQYAPGLAFSDTAMRFYPIAASTARLPEYLMILRQAFIKFAFLFGAGGAIFFLFFYRELSIPLSWLFPTTIFSIASVAHLLLLGIFNGARARRTVAFLQLWVEWNRFFLAGLFVWLFHASVFWAMSGFAFGISLIVCFGLLLLQRYKMISESLTDQCSSLRADMFNYCWPLLISGLLIWVAMFVDRWALGLFSSVEEIGKYFVLYQLGFLPGLLGAQALRQFISPLFFDRLSQVKTRAERNQVYKVNFITAHTMLGLSLFLFVIALASHKFIFSVLVGETYRSVSFLWPYMVLAGGITISSSGLLVTLFADMRTKLIIPMKLTSTILVTGCVMVGAKVYGISGVVFGVLFFAMLEFVITEVVVVKLSSN